MRMDNILLKSKVKEKKRKENNVGKNRMVLFRLQISISIRVLLC